MNYKFHVFLLHFTQWCGCVRGYLLSTARRFASRGRKRMFVRLVEHSREKRQYSGAMHHNWCNPFHRRRLHLVYQSMNATNQRRDRELPQETIETNWKRLIRHQKMRLRIRRPMHSTLCWIVFDSFAGTVSLCSIVHSSRFLFRWDLFIIIITFSVTHLDDKFVHTSHNWGVRLPIYLQ